MDAQLKVLIELQVLDTKIAGLEALLKKIPGELAAIRSSVQDATAAVEKLRLGIEHARKEIRAKEKDLEYQAAQRAKCEAKLYEVKTNKEYSAVLTEIEQFKAEQGKIEEEVLTLMETQERVSREHQESAARLKVREEEARHEEEVVRRRQAELEVEYEAVRSERSELAQQLSADLLASYERLLLHRHGLAMAQVTPNATCGGCYVSLTPQRFQEVRQQSQLIACESCGRFLYWIPFS